MIKGPTKPLKQLCRRLKEINFSFAESNNCNYSSFKGPKIVHTCGPSSALLITANLKNTLLLKWQFIIIVVQIHNVIAESSDVLIIGKQFLSHNSLFLYPFDSVNLDIFQVSNLAVRYQTWHVKDIVAKCLSYSFQKCKCVFSNNSLKYFHSSIVVLF